VERLEEHESRLSKVQSRENDDNAWAKVLCMRTCRSCPRETKVEVRQLKYF